jgi:DNA-binding MarR family transcriptional regulator
MGSRQNLGRDFLTTGGLPRNPKDAMILEILRLFGAGRSQTQVADILGLSRQKVNYWAGILEEHGHISPDPDGKNTSGGKYYKLSEKCQKLLSASAKEFLDAVLESRLRVEHLNFEAEILEKDAEGLKRLKHVLTKVDGIRHWNRYAGTHEDVSFELHEGIKGCDKLVIHAGKNWIGKSSAELVSRAQTACEGYARIIERAFKLRLSPLRLAGLEEGKGPRWEFAIRGDPVIRLLMRVYRKIRTESAQADHSSPHPDGEVDYLDPELFDDYVRLPAYVRMFLDQQYEIVSKLDALLAQEKDGDSGGIPASSMR